MGHYITFSQIPKSEVSPPVKSEHSDALLLDHEEIDDLDTPADKRIMTWKNQRGLLGFLTEAGYCDCNDDFGPWVIRKEEIDGIVKLCREHRAISGDSDPWTQYVEFEAFIIDMKNNFDFDNHWLYYVAS